MHRVKKMTSHLCVISNKLGLKPRLTSNTNMVSQYVYHDVRRYTNKSAVLEQYPDDASGEITKDTFSTLSEEIVPNVLEDDEIIVKIESLSIDGFLRTTMFKPDPTKVNPGRVSLGGKMHAFGAGKVIESKNNTNFKCGDYIMGNFPVSKYSLIKKSDFNNPFGPNYINIDTSKISANDHLTFLGTATGVSAYAAVYYVSNKVKKDDIIVVNAASGGIGSLVCQLYKNLGGKVIGITGGENKKDYLLNTLKLHQCIDYKNENINDKLKEYAPNGFDIGFDNVGGKQLEILLDNLKSSQGEIILCGALSEYSKGSVEDINGPSNYMQLCFKNAQLKGFAVYEYLDRIDQIKNELINMIVNEKLILNQVPIYGIENFYLAMKKLMDGDKNGKILLHPHDQ